LQPTEISLALANQIHGLSLKFGFKKHFRLFPFPLCTLPFTRLVHSPLSNSFSSQSHRNVILPQLAPYTADSLSTNSSTPAAPLPQQHTQPPRYSMQHFSAPLKPIRPPTIDLPSADDFFCPHIQYPPLQPSEPPNFEHTISPTYSEYQTPQAENKPPYSPNPSSRTPTPTPEHSGDKIEPLEAPFPTEIPSSTLSNDEQPIIEQTEEPSEVSSSALEFYKSVRGYCWYLYFLTTFSCCMNLISML
jgi:hypothetical protein